MIEKMRDQINGSAEWEDSVPSEAIELVSELISFLINCDVEEDELRQARGEFPSGLTK